MNPQTHQTRRSFLATSAGAIGTAGWNALSSARQNATSQRAPRNCIVLMMPGGMSHIDLFDPKPALARLHGRPLPDSFRHETPPGFARPGARLMASPFGFRRYGACGMELSELLPHIGSCADDILLVRSVYTEAWNHFAASELVAEGWPGLTGDSIKATSLSFAEQCRLAPERIERGERIVTIRSRSWDHHQDLASGLRIACQEVDQPTANLLKTLKGRGLLESTLVICLTDFGRSPLAEPARSSSSTPGRDHHATAFSVWMAGAGIAGGRVIGQTDEIGWNIVENAMHVRDLRRLLTNLSA